MALDSRLEIKLLQKLILTPQLQQAIKLLQMPQLELQQSLTNELMENPFLEESVEEGPSESSDIEVRESEPSDDYDDTEAPLERMMSFSNDDYFEERGMDGRDLGYFNPGTVQAPSFENFVSREEDLHDHLIWQLRFSNISGKVREAAENVIGNLDENGYLESSDEDIARLSDCSIEEAREAVRFVQGLDPTGVGARNLTECLLLQTEALGLKGSLVESLIRNNLEDLEKKRYAYLAKKYACTPEDILAAVHVIEKLEPKPGRNYSTEVPVYIVPDVYIVRSEGDFHIILNDEGMPRLRLNSIYRKLLGKKNSLQKEERQFLDEKLRSAIWLLKSLEQRNKTIYRVAESILKFQRDFFEKGVSQLKPLNLRDVAGELGMHESTISRATSSKYLSCDHGLFSLKFFFSSGLSSGQGKMSSTSVKDLIKKIISEEDSKKPLSDQEIVELCKESSSNINIARRTVAKYRKELGIAPQNQRKRYE
jgi:RNA polymerase sigma-54 factor